jgi:tetratricopeptide (TPR) repeat protein
MNNLAARILLDRGEIHEAEMVVEKYLEYAKRERMKKHGGAFLRLLGEVQLKLNNHDRAIESMGEGIKILTEVGNPRQLWQAYASLASAYSEMGRNSEAREQWQAAASVVETTAGGLQDEGLRTTFLNAAPVREIMEGAKP